MKYGITNAKGGGGSATSGCYLLQNASSMTHLYAYTYEGLLLNIDNKNSFPLKDGDTLIGDDNYVYKLLDVDEDLGTFTCVQFWKLESTTPTIEIDFSQALSSDTYALDSDQFGLIQNNEVVKVDLYSESELLTFVKKSDDGSNIVMGTIITYDSTNSVYVYKEAVINVSSYEMTITDMTLSSGGGGKQLYQHNIRVKHTAFYIKLQIINDNNTQFSLITLRAWLFTNGFGGDVTNMYICTGYSSSVAKEINGINASQNTGDVFLNYSQETSYTVQSATWEQAEIVDTIIPL